MKETIKKSFVGGIVFLFTVVIGGMVYAATVGTVTTGQTLTADMWNAMAGDYNYSLSEVNTGKKWIDGKPIYRKVINTGVVSSSTTAIFKPHGISNIDNLVDLKFFGYRSDGIIDSNASTGYWSSTLTKYVYVKGSDLIIYLQGLNWIDSKVILEYTKTTD